MNAARSTVALVLAGGRGERLRQLTDLRAKPAVPFGGKFRIIDFTLSNCVNSGTRRIGICTQYRAQSLIRHVQRGWSFLDGRFNEFVELLPAQQRETAEWYRGTADAVCQNLDILRRHDPEHVLVLAGDHVYKMDYSKMLAQHVAQGSKVTVACTEVPLADAVNFGVVQVDERGLVRAFAEKPPQPTPLPERPDATLASMGIYLFGAEFLYEELRADARARPPVGARLRQGHPAAAGEARRPGARAPFLGELRQHGARPAVLARRRHGGRVLGGEPGSHPGRPGPQHVRPGLADLDLPGAAAAGQVRVRRRRAPRPRARFHRLGRLHHQRLEAQALAPLQQRPRAQLLRDRGFGHPAER